MPPSLLQIRNYTVDDSTWTALTLYGKLSQATINFTADLKLRSDPADATTEYICVAATGTSYAISGLAGSLSLQNIVYAQSVAGSQMVVVLSGELIVKTA